MEGGCGEKGGCGRGDFLVQVLVKGLPVRGSEGGREGNGQTDGLIHRAPLALALKRKPFINIDNSGAQEGEGGNNSSVFHKRKSALFLLNWTGTPWEA